MTFCKNRSSGRTGRHGMLSSSPTGQKSGDNHRKRPSKHKIYLRRTLSYIISGKDAFEGLDRWVRTKDRASSLSIQFHMVVPSDNQSPMRVAPVIQENQGHAFSCPICNFRATCHYGVWYHCNTDHGEEFSFRNVRMEDDSPHIVITPRQRESTTNGTTRTSLKEEQTEILYWYGCPKKLAGNLGVVPCELPFLESQKQLFPKRNFYHSATFQRISLSDWIAGVDSEDEVDEEWKELEGDLRIDDFDDLSNNEKTFFKLWNRFVKESSDVIRVANLSNVCKKFLKRYGKALWPMERELISHLLTLWDEGHLSADAFHDCMALYQDLTQRGCRRDDCVTVEPSLIG